MLKVLFFKSISDEPKVMEIENSSKFTELVGGEYSIIESQKNGIIIIANKNEIDFSRSLPLSGPHLFVKKVETDNKNSYSSLTDAEIEDLTLLIK